MKILFCGVCFGIKPDYLFEFFYPFFVQIESEKIMKISRNSFLVKGLQFLLMVGCACVIVPVAADTGVGGIGGKPVLQQVLGS